MGYPWQTGEPVAAVKLSATGMIPLVAGGSSNAYTGDLDLGIYDGDEVAALVDGMAVLVEANHTNNGPATFNLTIGSTTYGAKTIKKLVNGGYVDVDPGDIVNGKKYIFGYHGSDTLWVVLAGLDDAPTKHPMIWLNGMTSTSNIFGVAMDDQWNRIFCALDSTTFYPMKNITGDRDGAFIVMADINKTNTIEYICFCPTANKFYGINSGGTAVYRFDNDDSLSNEATMSISGTGISSALGIDVDASGNIYILDNDAGTKKVRKYSVSGTTMTHVSNTTLDTNAPNASFVVIGSYWYAADISNNDVYKFNTSGVTQTSVSYHTSFMLFRGIMRDPDDELRAVIEINSTGARSKFLARMTF